MTDPVSRLGEIKARLEAATIGEWCADPVEDSADWFVHSAQGPAFGIVAGQVTHEADAEFIAAALADVGWLLEHIEQLHAELDACRRWQAKRVVAISADPIFGAAVAEVEELRAQRQAVLDLCDAWLKRTPGERAAADADADPLTRSYHRGLIDGSATAIERIREALGADDDR